MENPDGVGELIIARMTIESDSVSFDFEGKVEDTVLFSHHTRSHMLTLSVLVVVSWVRREHSLRMEHLLAHLTWVPLFVKGRKQNLISQMQPIRELLIS